MATNPNNAIGTNAAYGGRTSPKAFNDVLSAFNGRGILSGWQVAPNSGMTIALGGDGDNRDVAIAEDNAGNMTTVNNITGSPISFTIAAAPASQSRIDAIVVYVNNPPQGASTATDNYGAVGILDVQGTVAGTPAKPNDSDIRTAITADGASGATAYYVVLGYITIANGTTTITSNLIEQGSAVISNIVSEDIIDGIVTTDKIASNAVTNAKLANNAVTTSTIANNAVTAAKVNLATFQHTKEEQQIGIWHDGKPICRKILTGNTPNAASTHITHGITNFYAILEIHGYVMAGSNGSQPLPRVLTDALGQYGIAFGDFTSTQFLMQVGSSSDIRNKPYEIELVYLKSS